MNERALMRFLRDALGGARTDPEVQQRRARVNAMSGGGGTKPSMVHRKQRNRRRNRAARAARRHNRR